MEPVLATGALGHITQLCIVPSIASAIEPAEIMGIDEVIIWIQLRLFRFQHAVAVHAGIAAVAPKVSLRVQVNDLVQMLTVARELAAAAKSRN
jgi:hypothetical protein